MAAMPGSVAWGLLKTEGWLLGNVIWDGEGAGANTAKAEDELRPKFLKRPGDIVGGNCNQE
jgi:hypothetical protein